MGPLPLLLMVVAVATGAPLALPRCGRGALRLELRDISTGDAPLHATSVIACWREAAAEVAVNFTAQGAPFSPLHACGAPMWNADALEVMGAFAPALQDAPYRYLEADVGPNAAGRWFAHIGNPQGTCGATLSHETIPCDALNVTVDVDDDAWTAQVRSDPFI